MSKKYTPSCLINCRGRAEARGAETVKHRARQKAQTLRFFLFSVAGGAIVLESWRVVGQDGINYAFSVYPSVFFEFILAVASQEVAVVS